MRLAELGRVKPEQAGVARLEYSDVAHPLRENDVIRLPNLPEAELFSARNDWEQFLFHARGRLWFGGTDERPFLVELNESLLSTYFHHGAEAFFDALIPSRLLKLKELLPDHQSKLSRQGDIFFLSVSYASYNIANALQIVTGVRPELRNAKDLQVFGTRHILNGEGFQNIQLCGQNVALMVAGELTAPDHAPVQLKRMSVLGQTQGLADPVNAD